jgi:hypothetical protein
MRSRRRSVAPYLVPVDAESRTAYHRLRVPAEAA